MAQAGPWRMTRRPAVAGFLLLLPAVLLTASLLIAMLVILRFSFYSWSPETGMTSTWTLDNYIAFFADPFNYRALVTTLRIAVVTTVFAIVLGYPVAYLLSISRHKTLLLALIVLPLFVDLLIRAYGWVVLLSRNGLVNQLLVASGLAERPVRFLGTEIAVVLELLHEVLPFMILPIARVLERGDPMLREAAIGLGASRLTAFLRITLPLSLPGVIAGSLLTFSIAASAFAAPLILGGGRVLMISILIQQQMSWLLNWAAGSATSIVLVLLVSGLLLGYGRALRARPARAG
jgi:putative spermidine/putrescine transport system permease protein